MLLIAMNIPPNNIKYTERMYEVPRSLTKEVPGSGCTDLISEYCAVPTANHTKTVAVGPTAADTANATYEQRAASTAASGTWKPG